MKHILVLPQVCKPQRIYNIFLEIVCPNEFKELSKLKSNTHHVPRIPNLFTNFTMLIYFIMTHNLFISTKHVALLWYYYRPAN